MAGLTNWRSPNGEPFQVAAGAEPVLEPFFNRLNQVYPQYKSAGGYAHRPKRTLDGRMLGGLSTHATGYTLDVKAPDPVLRQMAQEFPHLTWGGKFSHYDPVHFEFGPTAQKHGALPPLNPASLLDPKAAAPVAGPGPQPIAGGGAPMTPTSPMTPYDGMMPADVQKHRKLAQMLAGQATDASPVGHWTQALARVVQGGVGGMHDRAATEGERAGQASIATMMASNPSAAAMMSNPYTQDMGKQLYVAEAKQRMDPTTALQADKLRMDIEQERQMGPLKVAAAKKALEADRRGTMPEGSMMWVADPSAPDGVRWIGPGGGANGPTPAMIKSEKELRTEFSSQPQVKEYQTVRNAFQNVKNAAKDPSAAGDLSMIFAYMKILDPNSVVREQEFANAQNAAGVPDRIRNVYNRIMSGERLNPEQRKDFQTQAEKLHASSLRQYDSVRRQFGDIAKNAKARPDQVMIDFGEVPDPNAAPNPNTPAPVDSQPMPRRVQNKDGVILEERDGQWVRVK